LTGLDALPSDELGALAALAALLATPTAIVILSVTTAAGSGVTPGSVATLRRLQP
jgi:hypothetical protein